MLVVSKYDAFISVLASAGADLKFHSDLLLEQLLQIIMIKITIDVIEKLECDNRKLLYKIKPKSVKQM